MQNDPSVKHVTVLGGGFVGCEVALALAERGRATGMTISQASTAVVHAVEKATQKAKIDGGTRISLFGAGALYPLNLETCAALLDGGLTWKWSRSFI